MYDSELGPMKLSLLQFAEFELDPQHCQLRRGERKVELERMPMELLILLLEKHGGLVERDEIIERLWGKETFVDATHGINTAIKKIRAALRDDSEQPRFIQTIKGRGYRFLAPIKEVQPVPPEPISAASSAPGNIVEASEAPNPALAARLSRRRFVPAMMLLLILASGAILFELVRSRRNVQSSGAASANPIQSLAVLPLTSLSRDPSNDYFADGLTDELITDLAQMSSIRVISHTSVMQYKQAKKPLPKIAKELNVDAVVEGSVLHGDHRVRITAQLLDARTDRHLWARSYTRDESDVVTMQTEVARDIGHEIAAKLVPDRPVTNQTKPVSAEAYDSYLRGRYFWNRRTLDDLNRSIIYYQQALKSDPDYAKAYAALGDAYVVLSSYGGPGPSELLRAREVAEKALQLDGTLAEAHTVLAAVKVDYDCDWQGGENEFRRALEMNPGYPNAHHWYALHLSRMGRYREAELEMQRALELDPLSSIINTDAAEVFYRARKPGEAVRRLRRSLEMDANFAKAHWVLGKVYEEKKEFANAMAEFEIASKLFNDSPRMEASRAHVLALSGKQANARKIVNRLERLSAQRYVSNVDIASVYCALDEPSTAIQRLRKARQIHDKGINTLASDALFDGCRSDGQFRGLLKALNLPAL